MFVAFGLFQVPLNGTVMRHIQLKILSLALTFNIATAVCGNFVRLGLFAWLVGRALKCCLPSLVEVLVWHRCPANQFLCLFVLLAKEKSNLSFLGTHCSMSIGSSNFVVCKAIVALLVFLLRHLPTRVMPYLCGLPSSRLLDLSLTSLRGGESGCKLLEMSKLCLGVLRAGMLLRPSLRPLHGKFLVWKNI